MQPGWPLHSTRGRQQLQNQLQRQLPARPLLSQSAMEGRAEINTFAIFLFCLLLPLGSLAPTSKSKVTAGEQQSRSTTVIDASVVEHRANELFEFYASCVSATFHRKPETVESEIKDTVDNTIRECPAFHANCCALHYIHKILRILKSDIETICNRSSEVVVEASLNQLDVTLSQDVAFYTCDTKKDVSQLYPQGMGLADKKNYIWWVLKKYKNITRVTENQ